MTFLQLTLQVLGLAIIYVPARRNNPAQLALGISFWLQYQLRDILNACEFNPNILFGLDPQSPAYIQTLIQILILNALLLGWMILSRPSPIILESALGPNGSRRQDNLVGYSSLLVLTISFIYFGGVTDRAEMILQKGSSLIYLSSLMVFVHLCHRLDRRAILMLAIATLFSTQKMLLLAFLIAYLVRIRSIKALGIAALGAILLVGAAVLREPNLSTGSLITFLGGTLFGHYESILPLYKMIDMGFPLEHFPLSNVVTSPFTELLFWKQEKFFEHFNTFYVGSEGILIAPSILGFFYYYLRWLAPFASLVYIILAVDISRRLFTWLLGPQRQLLMHVCFCLMLLESSPDGLSFFLRVAILLAIIKGALHWWAIRRPDASLTSGINT